MKNKNKIVETASSLFNEKGVEKTSLTEIACRAKISKGTLYYYFKTKNDLVFAVSEMHMNQMTEKLLVILEEKEDPKDIAYDLYSTITSAITRSRLHIYLVREAVTGDPELKKKFVQIYKKLRNLIIDFLKKHSYTDKDPKAVSSFIIASLDGLVIQNLLGIDAEINDYASLLKDIL